MRRAAGLGVLLAGVSACSVLYDPDGLPADASVRDASDRPAITAVEHGQLFEGQGTGGSRLAVIRLVGRGLDQFNSFGASWVGGLSVPIDEKVVAADGSAVVLTMVFAVDRTRDSGERRLNITAGGNSAPIEAVTMVRMLPELSIPAQEPDRTALYSQVVVTAPASYAASELPVIIRSTGDITVESSVSVDASGPTAGPGACTTTCAGAGQMAPANKGGGGGGFGTAGTQGGSFGGSMGPAVGSGLMIPLGAPNQGQPGGSGNPSGAGGGGGGSIALWAEGDVAIVGTGVSASGGNGVQDTSAGGGGSGGAILVHAGGTLRIGAGRLRTPGGTGARDAGSDGGDGGVGRVRIDASAVDGVMSFGAAVTAGVSYRGPSFSPLPPVVVPGGQLNLGVVAQPHTELVVTGTMGGALLAGTTDANGVLTFSGVALLRGVSHLCITEALAGAGPDVGESCIDIGVP